MFKNLAIIIALLIPLKCNAELQPGPLLLVLVGSKDAVTSVLNESMNIEFSRGVSARLWRLPEKYFATQWYRGGGGYRPAYNLLSWCGV